MPAQHTDAGAVDVLCPDLDRSGWGPIGEMVRLAARSFGGTLTTTGQESLSRLQKVRVAVPPRPGRADHLLVIAPLPNSLDQIAMDPALRKRYATVSAWVIDSFWHERIPRIARQRGWFDHIYVMDSDDADAWDSATPSRTAISVLPWGTDTLRVGEVDQERDVDLLRVGRQPSAWEDDDATAVAAGVAGVRFAGRPGFGADEAESRELLRRSLADARAVLSFGNRVSPTPFTHPTREYLTGRWTDALGHGCMVAGVLPRAASTALVPEAARIDVSPTDVTLGLAEIKEALVEWTPERAENIHEHAREHLDWRHRFHRIAEDLGTSHPVLDAERALL